MDMKISLLAVWLYLFIFCRGDDVGDLFNVLKSIPHCGSDCILKAIPESQCHYFTNVTCICTDKRLYDTVNTCVASSCNITESLAVARGYDKGCHVPKRSRRIIFLAILSVHIVALSTVLLRLSSRWFINRRYDVDDWVMVLATVLYTAFVPIGTYAAMTGLGVDTWEVDMGNLTLALELFYTEESSYLAILALTKISILFFYLRIFPQSRFRTVCWGAMAWVAVAATVFIFLQIFQCWPIHSIWEAWKGNQCAQPYHCLDVNATAYAAAGSSIAQDIAILALPLPLLLKLNTTWRRKLGIMVMFSLGIFVLVTSCVRLRFIVQFARSRNPAWDYADSLIWSGLEVAVSMLVTSLPAVRVLLVRVWPKIFGTTVKKSSGDEEDSAGLKHPGPSPASSRPRGKLRKQPVRSPQSRLFSMLAKTRDGDGDEDPEDDPGESGLELMDWRRGKVRAEIGVGDSSAGVEDTSSSPYRLTLGSMVGTSLLGLDDDSIGSTRGVVHCGSPVIRVEITTTKVVGSDQP